MGPLQTAYGIAQSIGPGDAALPHVCVNLMNDMSRTMIDETPVYDAVLTETPDFGEYNLALFTRIYAFFHDFRREIETDAEGRCAAAPTDEIAYVMRIMTGGFAYYRLVAEAYPNVTPLQDGLLPTSSP